MTGVALAPSGRTVMRGPVRRLARRVGGGEALAGIVMLAILIAIGVLAPLISPHDPEAIETGRVLGPRTSSTRSVPTRSVATS